MIRYIITATAAVAGLLMFYLLMSVRGMMGGIGARTYLYINNRLKERRGSFLNYQELQQFLKKNGAEYVIGKFAEPVKYLGLCITLFAIGMLIGSGIHPVLMLVLGGLAAVLPGTLILHENGAYNDKILGDIQMVYQFIAIQTAAGVYISDALQECYESVINKRMRRALARLSDEIAMGNDMVKALDDFSGSFDNAYINTLCVIIRQSMESGRSIDLLSDVSEQLKEVEENILYKKRERLSRRIGLLQLLFFSGLIAFLLYAFIYELQNMILNF